MKKVTPISCDSVTGTTVKAHSIGARKYISTVIPKDGKFTSILSNSSLLELYQQILRAIDFPVRWFISDLSKITTGGGTNQNTVTTVSRELEADPSSNDQELTLIML